MSTKTKQRLTDRDYHPLAGILPRDRAKVGVKIQTYGFDRSGKVCIHCGPHWVPQLSAKWLWRLHTHWLRWRKWYDHLPANRQRNYPAKQLPTVGYFGGQLIDGNRSTLWIKV